MALTDPILKDRFRGCLLGLAVGDALGGKFEAHSADAVRARFPTDTLAAMAGALSGAYLGSARLPARLVGLLESSPKGRSYLLELADGLFAASQRGRS
jgi:ADP-ribosylglycohydrolase